MGVGHGKMGRCIEKGDHIWLREGCAIEPFAVVGRKAQPDRGGWVDLMPCQ